MRERPAGLDERELIDALGAGWDIRVRSVEYLPVGGGSYHWSVTDQGDTTWFVKVDDLDKHGARDAGFADLSRRFGTALSLRDDARLEFVLAPVPDSAGAPVRRLTKRHALSVFPMIEGSTSDFGPHPFEDRFDVVDLLAALHQATPVIARTPPLAEPGLSRLTALHEALGELGVEWTGGPYSERARALVAAHAHRVERWLAEFDVLLEQIDPSDGGWVVTHGEPHPGNILRTPTGRLLIDWDTVALAPPERDVWMLTGGVDSLFTADEQSTMVDAVTSRYARATGRDLSSAGLALYRLRWILEDVAIYVQNLREPHGSGEDVTASVSYLAQYLEG